ncbi:acetate kinase [Sediminicola sp. YIK13]|uniref:acetate/propionate family kinase n=1 Tax=Sediminicola sp. YIK13 TaxID=1453352 RepID=UPI000721F317|nr:acetate kinase [Sediminicola sp. YIK13]ALM06877.1 acetate kinase [Sediminicola sp. YIK13]
MKILILNSGSSSIKYQLIDMPSEEVLCKGLVERIGSKEALFQYKTAKVNVEETLQINTHKQGLQHIAALLVDSKKGIVGQANEIQVIGHRVVHGGTTFSAPTMVTPFVKDKIKDLFALAPLHNPHNWEGLDLAEEIFPEAKQVAVFDTAFHQTLPFKAKKYAIPNHLYDEHKIQVYGFHGISHQYVSRATINHLNKPKSKIICIHLGNGCSITAVVDGVSVDHSLGFTPANGLIMGSRSGDIDHSIIFYLVETLGYDLKEVNRMLLKDSGMKGLTGFNDLRDVQAAAEKGDIASDLALEMNAYRIKKYIGAYATAMNGLDAIVFTAGVGENSSELRKRVCTGMDFLGILMDDGANEKREAGIHELHTSDSPVKILVVPTNEELEIAKQSFKLVSLIT